MRHGFSVMALLVAFTIPASAASAPSALMNKSIVLSWNEAREQRNNQAGGFINVNIGMGISVYVSSAGRPFARMSAEGKLNRATSEHVGAGSGGTSLGGGARSLRFEGNTLVMQGTFGNFARDIRVNFDGGFSSCTATQVVGKSGSQPVVFKNTTGFVMEIRSIQPGSVSCSVKDGNVFQ